jgi:pimeloyl-ACP methyl ester carboxylesterase
MYPSKKKKSVLKSLIFILFLSYIGLGLILFIFQRNYIYFPDNTDFGLCQGFSQSEKLNLNGTRAYFKNNSQDIVVFYHGNAGSACDRSYLKDEFEKFGLTYLFVEYAGYSSDSQKPSKKLLINDVYNVNAFLKARNFQKVFIVGESLGASLATYHSSIANEYGLLLVSPYYRLSDVALKHYPLYPFPFLILDNYDNSLWVDNLKKVWIIHGENDDIIPIEQARKLYGSINIADKKLIIVKGASHNDIYEHPETFRSIAEFLGKYFVN